MTGSSLTGSSERTTQLEESRNMGRPKILIAEDERDIRELIVFSLQLSDYDVTDVPNGAEAVKKAVEINPDLIMLDVRMPKMTGYEACIALKQDERTREIPGVFLSARGQEAEIQEGTDAGAEEYLLKPFAPDELIERVTDILKKYEKL